MKETKNQKKSIRKVEKKRAILFTIVIDLNVFFVIARNTNTYVVSYLQLHLRTPTKNWDALGQRFSGATSDNSKFLHERKLHAINTLDKCVPFGKHALS